MLVILILTPNLLMLCLSMRKISKNSKSIKALNNINVKMGEKLSRKDELERRNNQLKNQYTDTQKQIDELNDIVIRESPEFEKKKNMKR